MSFHPLVIGSETFNSAGPGKYVKNDVVFGGPQDYVKISPGSRNAKTGITTASVLRYQEQMVTVGSSVEKHSVSVQFILQMTDKGTLLAADNLLASLSTFVDTTTLQRIVNGDS